MSGPKIIRITTREEVIQKCEGLLVQVDSAINQWLMNRRNLGGNIDHDVSHFKQQRENLQRMLNEEQFLKLQKAVPIVLLALDDNIAIRQEDAVRELAIQRQRQRQLKDNAKILLQQLQTKNLPIPASLNEQLLAITNGKQINEVNAILQQGWLLLTSEPTKQKMDISSEQQRLLTNMVKEESVMSFDQWKQINLSNALHQTTSLQKFDHYISELSLIAPHIAEQYSVRITQIDAEPNPMTHQLLLDSLNIELTNNIQYHKKHQAALSQLQQLMTEMHTEQLTFTEQIQAKLMQLNNLTTDEIEKLIHSCESILNEYRIDVAAKCRRDVILDGLKKLGYSVKEGMATAWKKDAKIVIDNPHMSGYGIEIGGEASASRLQIRPVRLTETENHQRDLDAETLWCTDFNKLTQWVMKQGSTLDLERHLAVGETPVKFVGNKTLSSHTENKVLNSTAKCES